CPLPVDAVPPQRPVDPEHMTRVFIEPTVLCNLDCYKSVCNKASGIVKTRSRPMMKMELFQRLVDEAGPYLVRLDLFNYGETFVHPQAVDMVEYVKSRFPRPVLYISTNGLMLDEAKIDRLVAAGVDELTFSVDGADPASYERYRIGGDFRRVRELMAYCVVARNRHGADVPFINWRYILFNWNDADAQMDLARRMAAEIGVDRLTWEITDHPADAMSHRYQPGTPDWQRIYHEIWDTSHLSNAIPGKRYRALIGPKAVGCGLWMRRNRAKTIPVRVENSAGMPWYDRTATGRRLVRLGAQLYNRRRELINRDYARAFLSRTLKEGEGIDIDLALPPVAEPGMYWLKFDMVSEGIDWFENAGSPVVWRRLLVI
ncbi:radical SAM protein, partial [bacterium]|nr:radical SAM protein [candidate division CSSED10-310 bacterium]